MINDKDIFLFEMAGNYLQKQLTAAGRIFKIREYEELARQTGSSYWQDLADPLKPGLDKHEYDLLTWQNVS